jgi:hypothetical protein
MRVRPVPLGLALLLFASCSRPDDAAELSKFSLALQNIEVQSKKYRDEALSYCMRNNGIEVQRTKSVAMLDSDGTKSPAEWLMDLTDLELQKRIDVLHATPSNRPGQYNVVQGEKASVNGKNYPGCDQYATERVNITFQSLPLIQKYEHGVETRRVGDTANELARDEEWVKCLSPTTKRFVKHENLKSPVQLAAFMGNEVMRLLVRQKRADEFRHALRPIASRQKGLLGDLKRCNVTTNYEVAALHENERNASRGLEDLTDVELDLVYAEGNRQQPLFKK